MKLSDKKCIPCSGQVPPLSLEEKLELKKKISPKWELSHDNTRLLRKEKIPQMAQPMAIAKKIADLADEEWHHPELHIGFNHLDIEIWTHKIEDLVESDFIFAAKVDEILKI